MNIDILNEQFLLFLFSLNHCLLLTNFGVEITKDVLPEALGRRGLVSIGKWPFGAYAA